MPAGEGESWALAFQAVPYSGIFDNEGDSALAACAHGGAYAIFPGRIYGALNAIREDIQRCRVHLGVAHGSPPNPVPLQRRRRRRDQRKGDASGRKSLTGYFIGHFSVLAVPAVPSSIKFVLNWRVTQERLFQSRLSDTPNCSPRVVMEDVEHSLWIRCAYSRSC